MDARIDGGAGDAAAGQAGGGQRALDQRRSAPRRPPGRATAAWPRTPPACEARARASFAARFRRAAAGCPTWWTVPAATTPRVRPNQLLAVVPAVRAAARRRRRSPSSAPASGLLTSLGLRSLAPRDPATAAGTAAAPPSATRRTTRAPCGRGSSGRTSTPRSGPASRWTAPRRAGGPPVRVGPRLRVRDRRRRRAARRDRLPVPGVVGRRGAPRAPVGPRPCGRGPGVTGSAPA